MKQFATPSWAKLITFNVRYLAALFLSAVAAGYAQASPVAVERHAVQEGPQPMAITDCLPCALRCIASPASACAPGNGNQPDVAAATSLLWTGQASDSVTLDQGVSLYSDVALRILYCVLRI